MEIGSATAEPGEKAYGSLKVITSPVGTYESINLVIVNGARKGPVLLVDAVHHGSELAGYEAILKLVSELDPDKMKGTFIGVPILNMDAFQARTRHGPRDNQDMDGIYPGKKDGTTTQQIIYTFLNEMVSKTDYLITCHGARDQRSPLTYVMCPVTGDSKIDERSREMAESFGLDIITIENPPSTGSLLASAVMKGVPSVMPEIGGLTDSYENRWHYVDLMKKGILNVMKYLGMIEGEITLPQKQLKVNNDIMRCKHGGLWIPEVRGSIQKPGAEKQMVKKGDLIARIVNPLNPEEEWERIVAPDDGIVIGLFYHPVVYPGDTVIYFGTILEEVENKQ
jgi:predicted deacylase